MVIGMVKGVIFCMFELYIIVYDYYLFLFWKYKWRLNCYVIFFFFSVFNNIFVYGVCVVDVIKIFEEVVVLGN